MTDVTTLRVARPTNHLAAITQMYARGLGLSVLAEFVDHDGFDGFILGEQDVPYHLEFTNQRGTVASGAPSAEHLLVFYIADFSDWAQRCATMIAAGFRHVSSHNPYWDKDGRTFEDVDGYRVVLQNARFPS
jgi:hypothetical protein